MAKFLALVKKLPDYSQPLTKIITLDSKMIYKQQRISSSMQKRFARITRIDDSINAIDGLECWGIKEGKDGLGIVKCEGKISGVFTTNRIKAAPVIVTAEHVKGGSFKGLVVNSGKCQCFYRRKRV